MGEDIHSQVIRRDNHLCQLCHVGEPGFYVSKKDRNGPYTLDNLVACCDGCKRIEEVKDLLIEALQAAYPN